MSMVDKFIKEHTRNWSNQYDFPEYFENGIKRLKEYHPWLTPDDARKAVEIAKEEILNDICEWIEEKIGEYCEGENIIFSAIHIENIDIFGQERFINDLKQAMKDET